MSKSRSELGAFERVKASASNGCPSAQFEVGLMLVRGEGVSQDCAEAAKWFRKAAEQGHADAQGALGLLYSKGEGVRKDHAEAVRWYRAAAEQGDTDAQLNLAYIHERAGIASLDLCEAKKWYGIASSKADFGAPHIRAEEWRVPPTHRNARADWLVERFSASANEESVDPPTVEELVRLFAHSVEDAKDHATVVSLHEEKNNEPPQIQSSFKLRYIYSGFFLLVWILLLIVPSDKTDVGLRWFIFAISPLLALAWTFLGLGLLSLLAGTISGDWGKSRSWPNIIMR
jgi:hypothetical protein